ncbi:MAG: hypothetical protein JWQ73_2093 [Variovorax sp.]|nr:hypothetical protein [Variovorax sp.]
MLVSEPASPFASYAAAQLRSDENSHVMMLRGSSQPQPNRTVVGLDRFRFIYLNILPSSTP